MASHILKGLLVDAMKSSDKVCAGKDKVNYGIEAIRQIDQAIILEMVNKVKNISIDDVDAIKVDKRLEKLDKIITVLAEIRKTYATHLKEGDLTKQSSADIRVCIKNTDERITAATQAKDKRINQLFESYLMEVAETVIEKGVSPRQKISERLISVGNKQYEYGAYIMELRQYLYRFYLLSDNIDVDRLQLYKQRAEEDADLIDFMEDYSRREWTIDFKFNFNLMMPLQFTVEDIDAFADSLKELAKLTNALVDPQNNNAITYMNVDYIKNASGDMFVDKTFSMWDRYIRVFELNKEKNGAIEAENKPKIDAIGRTIATEFGLSTKMTVADRRKAIREDYACALELIARAENGSLLA